MDKIGSVKQRVQTIIVICSMMLLIGKFGAYFLTNSVGILTDAMESIVNVVAGLISLYSIRLALRPKDLDHPLGHGKIELISASIEGILIVLAGGIIIYQGVQRLFTPSVIERLDVGIIVVALSGIINYILGWYSIRQGKKYDSMALVAGGKHLQSDTYSTIGLVIGLILLYYTGVVWIDSALAMIFGVVIAITGIGILRKTIKNLIDTVDPKVLEKIKNRIVAERRKDWIDIHNLKIINTGGSYFVDCDLTLPWFYDVRQAHKSCDELQECLVSSFPQEVTASIHVDPCFEYHCSGCQMENCSSRTKLFDGIRPITIGDLVGSENEKKWE